MQSFTEFCQDLKQQLLEEVRLIPTADHAYTPMRGRFDRRFDISMPTIDYELSNDWKRINHSDYEYAVAAVNDYKEKYVREAKKMLRVGVATEEEQNALALLFYIIYKISSYQTLIPSKPDCVGKPVKPISDNDFEMQPARQESSFVNCFVGSKTLHTVLVLDGIGDLKHFFNWFAAYANKKGIENTSVVIAYEDRFHDAKEINSYIQELSDDHPLKGHPDLKIVSRFEALESVYGKIFNAAISSQDVTQTYRALYLISTPIFSTPAEINSLARIGLSVCLINELGIENPNPTRQIIRSHRYNFGISANTNPKTATIGCFFSKHGAVKNVKQVLGNMSAGLSLKLFGASEPTTSKLATMQILAGYYQQRRDIDCFRATLEQMHQNSSMTPILFLTGINDLPSEIEELVRALPRLKVICANLSSEDYACLIDLLRTDTRHLYFCSGDNTFIDSIAIGKLPIFFLWHDQYKSEPKIKALYNLAEYVESCSDHVTDQRTKQLIIECANYISNIFRVSRLPSREAQEFFANHLAPYMVRQFELSERVLGLVHIVENESEYTFKLSVDKFAIRRKNSCLFMIQHYKQTQGMDYSEADFSSKKTKSMASGLQLT